REFGVGANIGRPQVSYRETIRVHSANVHGKFVRQTGGRGQYGHVVINISPTETGVGFLFEDKIRGGAIPREYISSVEQGVKDALQTGVIAGFPIIDVKVELVDGSYHDVDSSEMAFKIAGSMALKEGVKRSKPALLEPVMDVEVVTPTDYLGDLIGDLSSRRGRIGGMADRGDAQVIGASVPLGEMFGYATTLRSLSQGRAVYTMQFSHYEEVPQSKLDEIMTAGGY
ncbi:MAG: elongation factor G, partial [Gemmatimonadota bacterium]